MEGGRGLCSVSHLNLLKEVERILIACPLIYNKDLNCFSGNDNGCTCGDDLRMLLLPMVYFSY